MKKIILLILLIISTSVLYAEPYISGELTLSDTVNLSKASDYEIDNSAAAYLTLDMDVTSNGVKFYFEELLFNDGSKEKLDQTLNKAYLKYRLPYKDSYMNFQIGKSYYSMGGGLIYNAGNPMLENSFATSLPTSMIPTFWNGAITLPVYQGEDFDTLYLGFNGVLPIEDDSSKIGTFLNYEIGNKYFDNMEISVLTDLSSTMLSFGYDGTLYFDYGLYGKVDLQDTDYFDISMFLTKVYDKLTFNLEALYQNNTSYYDGVDRVLFATPTLSYAASDKLSLVLSNTTTVSFDDDVEYSNILSGSLYFSIVQGFDIYGSIASYFNDTSLASLTVGTNYEF
jgi:hypothetical protein